MKISNTVYIMYTVYINNKCFFKEVSKNPVEL